MDIKLVNYIVEDTGLEPRSVLATLELLADGCTVPFISRYRKEKTGNLDEVAVRTIEEKFDYYLDLEKRKETVIKSIKEQNRMTPELLKTIEQCRNKQALEDLYLPYKPKRRTRATIAKEKGLEPLADLIHSQAEGGKLDDLVMPFVVAEKGVGSVEEALAGARDIVAERLSEDAAIRGAVRAFISENALLVSKVRKEWEGKKSKFEQYYNFSEPLKDSPSHRILAIRRGSKEEVLSWRLDVDADGAFRIIRERVETRRNSPFYGQLLQAMDDCYTRLLSVSLEVEAFSAKVAEAGTEAISVFSKNLRNLLLSAPAGGRVIMGVDPGFRTGCKVVVIDRNGNFLEYEAIFPHPPQEDEVRAGKTLARLIDEYKVELIAIGNGTASRETDKFVRMVVKHGGFNVKIMVVSEAGASVYSASELAGKEFPDLDVTVRGAISIARRMQDPLAELVKIEPKSIGVGQYQHDVNQTELSKALGQVVESCVNHVGAEINTASAELLSYISGIGSTLAANIISYRTKNGSFRNKKELLKVSMLGPKAFEQCAGFLRLVNGDDPLDNSAIHPESYGVVARMAADLGVAPAQLIGNEAVINRIDARRYVNDEIGELTLTDILKELRKPGCDPRDEFTSIEFDERVQEISDLKEDMILVGTVTNVTNFGAFVDIGVHQDGLVHISQLADRYVRDPHEVVAAGDTVTVKVVTIDKELKRIGLSMKGVRQVELSGRG